MIVAFTGHRPDRLGEDVASAWIAIKEFLLESKPIQVISGMATGVDSLAFDIAVELGIPVIAAVPWVGHSMNWNEQDRNEYLKRLEKAAVIKMVSDSEVYGPWLYTNRNRWMVDNCDKLAAVWNGKRDGGTWNTIQYARRTKHKDDIIYLPWKQQSL